MFFYLGNQLCPFLLDELNCYNDAYQAQTDQIGYQTGVDQQQAAHNAHNTQIPENLAHQVIPNKNISLINAREILEKRRFFYRTAEYTF